MIANNLVSIILPVYNGEKYIKQSINSCLNQTYKNIELIIINDCSTDNTSNIINEYAIKDSRICIINNVENKKLPASLNIGHKAAKGDFMTWTSDDNFYELDAIELLHEALIKNNKDLVYSNVTVIKENGEVKRDIQYNDKENILFGNCIGSCFLYKKEVYMRNKGYNESLFLVEDYDFWLRASLHSNFYHLKRTLYKYRLHETSLTNSIHTNSKKNTLWKNNITKMYNDFVNLISKNEREVISQFQTSIITYQDIEFSWVKNNICPIKNFIKDICRYPNYSTKSKIDAVFLKQISYVFVKNKNNNIKNALFIIKHYYHIIDLNTIKTLIKYSFFK